MMGIMAAAALIAFVGPRPGVQEEPAEGAVETLESS